MTEQSLQTPVVFNLVDDITQLLVKAEHPRPTAWKIYLPADTLVTTDEKYQRYLINETWRRILGRIDLSGRGNTMDQRFCLIEDGSRGDWLRLFNGSIIPCIKQYEILYTE